MRRLIYHQITLTARGLLILSVCLSAGLSVSLTIHPYYLLLLAGYFLCPHRADVSKSLLVCKYLHIHEQEFKEERHLWVRPFFSSSGPQVSFVLLEWFKRWEAVDRTTAVLWVVTSRIYSRQYAAFLWSSNLTFFFMHFGCVHVVHPFSSMDIAAISKKSRFILSDRFTPLQGLYLNPFQSMRCCYRSIWTSLLIL